MCFDFIKHASHGGLCHGFSLSTACMLKVAHDEGSKWHSAHHISFKLMHQEKEKY